LPQKAQALTPEVDTTTVTIRPTAYNSKNGTSTKTTTTTVTVKNIPTTATPTGPYSPNSIVPALSSPAPDVSNGHMPAYPPGPGQPPATTP